jgi:hypothetical protein
MPNVSLTLPRPTRYLYERRLKSVVSPCLSGPEVIEETTAARVASGPFGVHGPQLKGFFVVLTTEHLFLVRHHPLTSLPSTVKERYSRKELRVASSERHRGRFELRLEHSDGKLLPLVFRGANAADGQRIASALNGQPS